MFYIVMVMIMVSCLILFLLALAGKKEAGGHHSASRQEPAGLRTQSTDKKTIDRVDQYFDLVERIRAERGKPNFRQLLHHCEESLYLIPAIVADEKQEYGKFNTASIPAIEIGLKYWAALQDLEKIQTVEQIINSLPELKPWEEDVRMAYSNAEFSKNILDYVHKHPGTLQSQLGKAVGLSGHTVRWLIYYLEKTGRLRRKKNGSTYELYLCHE